MIRSPLAGAIALALLLTLPPNAVAHSPAEEMADAARTFLASLDESRRERAAFKWDDAERLNWHFVPRDRKGLAWKDMTPAQRHLATALLASGLSQRGLIKATTIMSLEEILLELEQGRGPKRDPEAYFWSIFGEPSTSGTWAWRVEGHHLAINVTLVEGKGIATTPSFYGSNPAEVRQGPRKGLRPLAMEADLARELLGTLDAEQRRDAITSETAPRDILTGTERKVSPLSPAGLPASRMNDAQQKLLRRIIDEYVRRVRPELADADLKAIEDSGFEKVHFAWAGPEAAGQGHYYRVQGPTFLLEYDNTQNNANHIHTVWRDFTGDFGADLLAEHYRTTPH
jgi:hypothetical protein